jgi:cyanophycinase
MVLWFAALLLASVAAWADENPFGLPAPVDKNRPGSVMLHGGGRRFSGEVRQEFVRLAGGKDARIVLMPSDSYQLGKDEDGQRLEGGETPAAYERRMAAEYDRWVALRKNGRVADFQFLYRDRESDPDDDRLFDRLEQATGVWLPAHDQERLPAEFAAGYPATTSRFQLALRDVVARGGVVGGLSGGMASLPETIIAGNEPEDGGWVRARLRFGLALFNGAVVDQNFNAHTGRLERLSDVLRNGPALDRLDDTPGVERRTIGIGVEQGTVVILQRNTVRVIGRGQGHIFLKGNGDRTITWRTLSAGDEPLVVHSHAAKPVQSHATIPVRSHAANPAGDARGGDDLAVDPNPLGTPEPVDPERAGTVVLHGGNDTDEIIDLYPTLAGVPKPRLVHCPAARESCRPSPGRSAKDLAEHIEEVFSEWRDLQTEGRFDQIEFVTTDKPTDAIRVEFVRPLKDADALWFCGGSQRSLARLFVDRRKPTLFQQEVLNIVRRGGVVGGTSAGLAVMADIMIEGGEPEDGSPAEANLSRGLGVLKHVLAEQHFDTRGGRIERLTGLLRDHARLKQFSPTCQPEKMIGLAVEEDTALIVQASHLRVTGKKLAHIFLQGSDPRSVTWHALKPGDAAILRPAREGYVLELDDWEFGE